MAASWIPASAEPRACCPETSALVSLLKKAVPRPSSSRGFPSHPRLPYAHDPVLITDRGAIILQTGKPARRGEGPAVAAALQPGGVPILGDVTGEGTGEGGDMLWLDAHTLAVGRGFRTNQPGIEQLARICRPLTCK